VKKAVIAAAGLCSRLGPVLEGRPKGLLEIQGKALLERSVESLRRNGICEIAVVVGYQQDMIRRQLGAQAVYCVNPFYAYCNNMASLWFARAFIEDAPFVYLHSDLVYDERLLNLALKGFGKRKNDLELITEFGTPDDEAMKVQVTPDHYLVESHKRIPADRAAGEWTGMAFIRSAKALMETAERLLLEGNLNEYDTLAFSDLAASGRKVYCPATDGLPWIEIDYPQDVERAKKMFAG